MPDFSNVERRIIEYFKKGSTFKMDGKKYSVKKSGKPTCSRGEPKTDIYILAVAGRTSIEIKISYKKENADFIENKMNDVRARQIFGNKWKDKISKATRSIQESFYQKPLIYKNGLGRVGKGSITLGWKFELMNKPSGQLSKKMKLTEKQTYDVYAGCSLSEDKKDACVDGEKIDNSGVANYILVGDHISSAQDVIDKMEPIQEYIKKHPDVYFACKALNYRTFSDRKEPWDGNRPLSVYIDWKNDNGKMKAEYIFEEPLIAKGNQVGRRLKNIMDELNIKTTDDIDENNTDINKVNE